MSTPPPPPAATCPVPTPLPYFQTDPAIHNASTANNCCPSTTAQLTFAFSTQPSRPFELSQHGHDNTLPILYTPHTSPPAPAAKAVLTQRRSLSNYRPISSAVRRKQTLIPIPRSDVNINAKTFRSTLNRTPRMYVINAASLAKPHAIEQFTTELTTYSIDISFVCETHFKSKHSCDAFNVDGYTCMRRDRVGRRGGGVALFIKDGMNAQIIKMPNDLPQYETLW